MKVKALRDKDTKEFIHFVDFGEKLMVCTGELPTIQPMTATTELMKEIYPKEKIIDGDYNDFNNFEFVVLDLIEAGDVGADIRNKLSPYKNLVALIELLLKEEDYDIKQGLKKFIRKEIVHSRKSIKYLAELL